MGDLFLLFCLNCATLEPYYQVEQLTSPVFCVRRQAYRNLVDIGQRARPAILAGCNSADPEQAKLCTFLLLEIPLEIDAEYWLYYLDMKCRLKQWRKH